MLVPIWASRCVGGQFQFCETISQELTSRYVPRFIVEVDEVPVTINGKKVETAVKQIISGREIRVSSTVTNLECLRGNRRWVGFERRKDAKL
jgi:acetoacetyl-CoA synthetase